MNTNLPMNGARGKLVKAASVAAWIALASCAKEPKTGQPPLAKPQAASPAQADAAEDAAEHTRHRNQLYAFVKALQGQSFAQFRQDNDKQDVRTELLADKKLDPKTVDQIGAFLNAYYVSLPVTSTIQVPIAGTDAVVSFDCVPTERQPSMSPPGAGRQRTRLEAPPVDPDDASGSNKTPIQPTAAPVGAASTPSADPQAFIVKTGAPACPQGTVPIRRLSLPEAVLEPGKKGLSLSDEAAAATGGPPTSVLDRNAMRSALGLQAINTPQAAYKHRYAHAYQDVAALGISSRLSVWDPLVIAGDMSLSQVWVVGGNPNDSSLQTVEAGWQVYNYWQTTEPALFVYQTSDNYGSTGCYVTKCGSLQPARPESFLITNSKVIIGRPISPQSVIAGSQSVLSIKWIRNKTTGSWWLKVDDAWVGYYPASTFSGGALTKQASYVDFGGEATGLDATSQMGSGRYAEEGKGYAGFQSQLRYLSTSGAFVDATVTPLAPDSPCYTISLGKAPPPEPNAGNYFYFGGPGSHHFPLPPSSPEGCTPPPTGGGH